MFTTIFKINVNRYLNLEKIIKKKKFGIKLGDIDIDTSRLVSRHYLLLSV